MKGKTTCPKCHHEFIMEVPDESEVHSIICPTCSNSFVIKKTCTDDEENECGWEEYGEPRKTILSSKKKRTNRPIIASFFLLASGILGIFTAVIFATIDSPLIPELEMITSYFRNVDPWIFAAILAIFSIGAMVGSFTAFTRKYFYVSVVCAVLGIFSMGLFFGSILALAALILIIISRDEFENGTKGKVF